MTVALILYLMVSGSTPADTITNYKWLQTGGLTKPEVTIAPIEGEPQKANAGNLFQTDVANPYIFTLTVTDNNGITATDTVAVNVTVSFPIQVTEEVSKTKKK